MECSIKKGVGLKYEPVGIVLTDERPEKAKQFKEGKWGCVMFMLGAATKGKTAVFDRTTYGCWGGGVGLGFGNRYQDFPGGQDCFCYFLSTGNEQWEQGRQVAEQVKPYMDKGTFEDFLHGEGYLESPELVEKFVEGLPMRDIAEQYVVFKPLTDIDPDKETPAVVVFLGDMDQVSALTILSNYHRETNDNVIFPYAAGCMSICIYPLQEAEQEKPRAVLGLNDISARLALKRMLKEDVMSFAVPWQLYREMADNVPGSFLGRPTWEQLAALK